MQPLTTPRVLSGRYELTHLIARGGMAQVYRAHDRLLDRPVALKILFPELSVDRAFVERFRREAQAAANLSHPNIVPVFDWGEDAGTYYIVMEFIDGQPLSQVLRSGVVIPPVRVAQIGARVADALSYAHRHGVVHRDVKPGNVLLTNDEQVKVTDFGIARALNTEESLTQTGAVMGTATYFSPEQAEGMGVDARSDIYSLGVVLFEMVAGRPPFLGETPVSIASKHVRDRPPLLSDLNPTVPPALEAIIAKSMAKSADLRYQTAADMRADLVRYAEGRPVAAADPSVTALLAEDAAATAAMEAVHPTQTVPVGDGRGPGGPPTARRSHAGRWMLALLALLVVLVVVVYFVLTGLGYIGGFKMPTVRGKTVAAATSVLKGKGLDVTGKILRRASTVVTKTDVISTSPAGGSNVTKGTTVTLTVSTGSAKTIAVPTVETHPLTTAIATLEGDDLNYSTVQKASTKPSGTVLTQKPKAGTRVKSGKTVTLTVSEQNAVVVPPLVGLTTAAAYSKLGADNLTPGPQTSACSNTYKSGDVMAQTPASGGTVPPHTPVKLTVSSGTCNVKVLTEVGKTATSAKSALTAQGFKVQTHTVTPTSTPRVCRPATFGNVVAQTPAGNTTAQKGSTVTLDVCRTPKTSSGTGGPGG
jgi:eukaryotic-like serine/threonine-protein kinase